MSICPITYEPCEGPYSQKGLNRLSQGLVALRDFPYSAEEQLQEAAARSCKMSIQGVQPKLSAVFRPRLEGFEVVTVGGRFILKPQHPQYRALPENEDLTMRLAGSAGLEVPFHGLIRCKDRSFTYFIRRFDRTGRGGKKHLEDFAQLLGESRETKYSSSMEKVAAVVERYCSFPAVEKARLFALTLFNFLIGNEDMHLKNFSLIRDDDVVRLSPAYDLVNTTIALRTVQEEIALPIRGKKNRLTAEDLLDHYGRERLGLTGRTLQRVVERQKKALTQGWPRLLELSFLPEDQKESYRALIRARGERLGWEPGGFAGPE